MFMNGGVMLKRVMYCSQQDVPVTLYHITSISNLISILDSNQFNPGHWNNLSATTEQDYFKGPQLACLLLDVDLLMNDGYQFIRYTSEYAKSVGNDDGVDSEEEWRCICDNPILNFCKYIKEVKLMSHDRLFNMILDKEKVDIGDIIGKCNSRDIKVDMMW